MDPKAFYSSSSPSPTSSKLVQRIENIYNASVSQQAKLKNQQENVDPFPVDLRPWKPKPQPVMPAPSKTISSRLLPSAPSHSQIDVWEIFPIQKPALDLAKSKNNDSGNVLPVHVFAFEHDDLGDGKRRFIATSYEQFWHSYYRRPPEMRMHYEVIPEGQPVKLFFDLEFPMIERNRERDGQAIVDRLIGHVGECLAKTYPDKFPVPGDHPNGGNREFMHDSHLDNSHLDADANNSHLNAFPVLAMNENADNRELTHTSLPVLKLDASTSSKFSQHLIFPSIVFQDISHAGAFVRHMCRTLKNSTEEDLFIWKEDGQKLVRDLCIDEGVYTRNRNMRLYLSRKQGKDNPLIFLPTPAFNDSCTPREIFMASLVCNVDISSNFLQFSPGNQEKPGNRRQAAGDSHNPEGLPADTGTRPAVVSLHSPFPVVDAFIESMIGRDGLQSSIRQCQYNPDTNTIIYNIQGQYRYCERIGRHHKSNNIYFVANINQGTYYQKCMDPDCRQFRSEMYILPIKLNAPTDSTSNDDQQPANEDM